MSTVSASQILLTLEGTVPKFKSCQYLKHYVNIRMKVVIASIYNFEVEKMMNKAAFHTSVMKTPGLSTKKCTNYFMVFREPFNHTLLCVPEMG